MNKQTAQLLEQHFDTAFAAPDGIARLRELILTLAMQGKLVEQDVNDPPASELLREIDKERVSHEGTKTRRGKEKKLPPIKAEEVPYELPRGWEWVRLGEIGVWKSGSTPSRSNTSFYGGDIPWVKSGEVKQGRIKSTEETITQAALDKCPLQINERGSVLVAMYGANIGEVGILEIEAATNQAVCACKTYTNFDENYLLYLITSLKPYFLSQGAGAAQPNISREKIVATVFPLPPLPEQHRIVARIDQLMARCDALEKLRKEREEKRLAVHAAAIKQLLDSDPSFPRRRESSSSEELAPRLRLIFTHT
jgi:type I restriction enzyme S subunit